MAELGSIRDLRQRFFLCGVLTHKNIPAVKLHLVLGASQQLCAQSADLSAQLHGTLFGSLAGNVSGAGRIGAGVVGRGIRISSEYRDIVQRAVQHFGGDLRQCSVTAGAHIGRTDHQGVEAVVIQFQGGTAHIHAGNAGSLHRHAHTDSAHLAVAQITGRILVLPVDHIPYLDKAAVQCTAGIDGTIIGGHHIALLHGVFQTQLKGIHVQLVGQLIDGRFYRKQALRCTIAAVSTGRHVVRIHHITDKAECLCLAVQRDGFVTGKAHRRRAVLAIGTGIG